ncbi:hypothetical protein GTO10_03515 [Candidatus Saccharibacteria bacterium]|nr:hypothetical protein [Candidatus Saccharibacteria bacterium]
MSWIKLILTLLPELISLIKTAAGWIEEGMTVIQVKKRFKRIDDAFKIKEAPARARALNDVFRK